MMPDSPANGTHRPAAALTSAALLFVVGMGGPSSSAAATPSAPTAQARTAAHPAGSPAPGLSRDAGAVPRAAVGDWAWPVLPPFRITAPFLAPPTPYSAGHRGIDIEASEGAMVRAPDAGIVTFAGPVAGRGVVAIDHGGGIVSAIEPVAAGVAAGAAIEQGDQLGTVAAGGHCDGACVHFGVRLHGEYVSPLLFLGGVPRAVLLPMR